MVHIEVASAVLLTDVLHVVQPGAKGPERFPLEPVYDLCIKVILTQRKSDETFLPK